MKVKDLKNISASAITFIFYFCNGKQEAIDGIHYVPIYSNIYEDTFDDYEVFCIFPAGKDNLEVWIDKKGMYALTFSNIDEEQIYLTYEFLTRVCDISVSISQSTFIFTVKDEYEKALKMLDETMIDYEEHII